jgi:hypothetical protein
MLFEQFRTEVSGSGPPHLVELAVGQLETTDLGRRRLDLGLNGIFDGPI